MERLNTLRSLAPTRMPPRGPLAASKAAGRYRIEPGSALHLAGDTDVTVDIVLGRVWLTRAGDIHDHFPGVGTRLDFACGSDLMFEAHGGPAEVRLTPRLRGEAVTDGVGHGLDFAVPGKPLVGVASVTRGAVHAFAPVRAPSSPSTDGDATSGDVVAPVGDATPAGDVAPAGHVAAAGEAALAGIAAPVDHAAPGGDGRPAPRGGLGDWVNAILAAVRHRLDEARTRRLLTTLDSGQLRDIGAPAHLVIYRERLEREERLRQRTMFGGK